MVKQGYPEQELRAAQAIRACLEQAEVQAAVGRLQLLKDELYAGIPEKQRIGRGITWVVQRIAGLLAEEHPELDRLEQAALLLYEQIGDQDTLAGIPIFLMGQVAENRPEETYAFFARAAASPDWVVREFAQAGFRKAIGPDRPGVQDWLKRMAQEANPKLRRFAGETLRPVAENHWMRRQPKYSLQVLRLLFHEPHPYPRTSVGNNLSDLSRHQPELIFTIVDELVHDGDPNSAWIAYRACRNLVKRQPRRVLDLLQMDEYHYKDRNVTRAGLEVEDGAPG